MLFFAPDVAAILDEDGAGRRHALHRRWSEHGSPTAATEGKPSSVPPESGAHRVVRQEPNTRAVLSDCDSEIVGTDGDDPLPRGFDVSGANMASSPASPMTVSLDLP